MSRATTVPGKEINVECASLVWASEKMRQEAVDGMTRTKDTSEKSLWNPADAVGCRRSSINKMFRQKGDLVLEEHRNSSPMVVQSTCYFVPGRTL